MIDKDGFRSNVGIMLANGSGELLWARRLRQDAWQFPQGGINKGETPVEALYRELGEEIGLTADDVSIVAQTKGWLRYRLPRRLIRKGTKPTCIGQKQKWFLLTLDSDESNIQVDVDGKPEFDDWRWVSYWYPMGNVVQFKREVYRKALLELAPSHSQLISL